MEGMELEVTPRSPSRLELSVEGGEGALLLAVSETTARGTGDYGRLSNKPRIEGRELVGDVTLPEIKVAVATEHDIDRTFFG